MEIGDKIIISAATCVILCCGKLLRMRKKKRTRRRWWMTSVNRSRGILQIFSEMGPSKQMSFLFMVHFLNDMEKYFSFLKEAPNFNTRAKFVIVLLGDKTKRFVEQAIEILHQNKVLYFVLMQEVAGGVDFWTYYPFRNKMCGRFAPRTNIAYVGRMESNGNFTLHNEHNPNDFFHNELKNPFFQGKVPINLDKCPVRIVTSIWPPNVIDVDRDTTPGIEIEFVRSIAKRINFTPVYTFVDDVAGEQLTNKSWTGFMGYLERNEVDMAIGSIIVDINRNNMFDHTNWYMNNYMVWILPKAGRYARSDFFNYYIAETTSLSKILFFSAFFLVLTITLIINKLSPKKEIKNYGEAMTLQFILFKGVLGQPESSPPKTDRVRWIFGTWFLYCTIMVAVFNTSITSFFTNPRLTEQMNSMDQVNASGMEISYEKTYNYVVQFLESGEYYSRMNQQRPVIESLELVIKGKTVTLVDHLRAVYISQQWIEKEGHEAIYFLDDETTFPFWIQSVLGKGSYFFEIISAMTRKWGNNGLWNYMPKRYERIRRIKCSVRRECFRYNMVHGLNNSYALHMFNRALVDAFPTENSEIAKQVFRPSPKTEEQLNKLLAISNDNTVISFSHLSAIFIGYFIGISISYFVFVVEILHNIYYNTIKK